MTQGDTIFDRILRKEVSASVVLENEIAFAFHDVNPQAPVHVLVIPKKKIKSFAELTQLSTVEAGGFMQTVAEVAQKLGLDESGYRIVFNTGRHGQQSVDYIHAHILGGRQMQWPPG